ncbi:tetratricopeptide repeat protein [Sphingomonas sp. QA11]|uniref:tetratricopeptide repeat protein n=1 Tax=Sphingomonas sp. QA11 TaxID=2950605 RepID=UPI002349389A|nr:tetratricopeptide repeat protein [Sphingomonas sp. QA11]WCM29365.1 tetratricopeptide repeat protein [Sphingomonas sp. QA11]
MRIGSGVLIAGIVLAGAATAATASDRTGFIAIKQGDFSTAERTLVAERRIYPSRPELMLNLAAVYRGTGRRDEARVLYEAVLARPNTLMDVTADRTAWSHTLATAGLSRLDARQMSSR